MRYVLISLIWLVKGLATDVTGFDAILSVIGWACTVGIMRSWWQHDRDEWADMLDTAADLGLELESLEAENDELREKIAKHERSQLEKLREKSHRKSETRQ